MKVIVAVALDVLREARSRRWVLALAIAISLTLISLALSLRMDVLDGALASTRLFGALLGTDIRSVDVALRPVFRGAAYVIYYGGLSFGILGCADFAPSLLSPGRIEQLLALPIRRWELLVGTFLGVTVLAVAGALYGAGGLVLLLGAKTGVWTIRPVLAALLTGVGFSALYAAMLSTALLVRSAALSAAVGGMLFVAGIVAGYRVKLAPLFHAGLGRSTFQVLTAMVPPISTLADTSASLAASAPVETIPLFKVLTGFILFGLGVLALGAWHFEQKDF